MGRRQRRVLYEVVQPSKDDLSIWKSRPTPVKSDPPAALPAAISEPDHVPHAGVSPSAYARAEEPARINVSRQTIAISATAVVMLLLVAFSAGRHFEAARSISDSDSPLVAAADSNEDTPAR